MIRVAILTVSDSAFAGTREDASGPALADRVRQNGWQIAQTKLVKDEAADIAQAVTRWADSGDADVILCAGGTGLAPRDVTPDALRSVAAREVPGFGEVMRAEGRKSTKFSPLSRSGAFTRGSALIVALPGSPRGAVESLNAVADLIPHAVNLLHGHSSHETLQEREHEKETGGQGEASQKGG
ncbi:MAG: MogA/MoaB family molybdenum cofactor biosynthesis protein [Bryobacterales bacterium]|nr:MogA/MoaB family molybdenum cofactor biosynthesis protein [Bryobacterales bacterium]MBV9400355.1 MogA/MoaB family molybdenum cofactor biosynthesis protein [Bryobacterales bacterium]